MPWCSTATPPGASAAWPGRQAQERVLRAARRPGRRAARLPARRLSLADAPGRQRLRRGAGRRHGPGQDGADPGPAAAARRRRAGAGGGADLGVRQLAARGGAFCARPARRAVRRRADGRRARGRSRATTPADDAGAEPGRRCAPGRQRAPRGAPPPGACARPAGRCWCVPTRCCRSTPTSWPTLRWHSVVLDEAQAIKNPATRRAKAALALQGDFRLALTGTPIENRLGELWSIMGFCNPGPAGQCRAVREELRQPDRARSRTRTSRRKARAACAGCCRPS